MSLRIDEVVVYRGAAGIKQAKAVFAYGTAIYSAGLSVRGFSISRYNDTMRRFEVINTDRDVREIADTREAYQVRLKQLATEYLKNL